MKWKVKFQGIILLFLLFVGCYSGIFAQDISKKLDYFSEVKVYNGVEVEIIPSEENRISITGHSKDEVGYEVVENRLEIKLSLEHLWSEDNTYVKIYANALETIDANESSIIQVSEELKGSSFTFRAQEGAAIYASVNSANISVKAVTGGIVQLKGKAVNLDVEVNTGGKFFGENLESEETIVTTGTGGHSEVYASKYIKATAKFGGVINVYGNPSKIDRKTTLGGKILEKN